MSSTRKFACAIATARFDAVSVLPSSGPGLVTTMTGAFAGLSPNAYRTFVRRLRYNSATVESVA